MSLALVLEFRVALAFSAAAAPRDCVGVVLFWFALLFNLQTFLFFFDVFIGVCIFVSSLCLY